MDIETRLDFIAPLELQTIFRIDEPTGSRTEYKTEMTVPWEMIDAVQSYPYQDDWIKFKGPKFWIHFAGALGQHHLVLGEYKTFKNYFAAFKRYQDNLFNGNRNSED